MLGGARLGGARLGGARLGVWKPQPCEGPRAYIPWLPWLPWLPWHPSMPPMEPQLAILPCTSPARCPRCRLCSALGAAAAAYVPSPLHGHGGLVLTRGRGGHSGGAHHNITLAPRDVPPAWPTIRAVWGHGGSAQGLGGHLHRLQPRWLYHPGAAQQHEADVHHHSTLQHPPGTGTHRDVPMTSWRHGHSAR